MNTQQVTAHFETITPERAAKLLERNTHNRPLSRPYVRELRREMEEGRWKRTHQGVAVADDGTLLDGQSRLTAIVESGISTEMLVTEGLARDAFDAIDQNRKRTGGQILAMAGVSRDAPRMIAMARAVLQVVYGNNKVSNTAAAEYAVKHQSDLEGFLPVARQFTPAVAAAFAWCHSLGWPEVEAGAERLVTNGPWEEPQESDPMRALTNRSRDFKSLGAGQAGIKGRFDLALNCLQAMHEGRGLRVARSYRPDYGSLEKESVRPPAMPFKIIAGGEPWLQAAIASIEAVIPAEPPPGSLAYEPPATSAPPARKRRLLTPAEILTGLGESKE